ncbi:unnamed protein product [Candidula unifasciata]|uniref:Uncharacterized protein n=1 Tax=Candidula unifasciata TaxID=100452 RepID=A0A8S4A3Y1_9EUPU|nr:unnamed protein product [Candidula unifasciata]
MADIFIHSSFLICKTQTLVLSKISKIKSKKPRRQLTKHNKNILGGKAAVAAMSFTHVVLLPKSYSALLITRSRHGKQNAWMIKKKQHDTPKRYSNLWERLWPMSESPGNLAPQREASFCIHKHELHRFIHLSSLF